MAENNIQEGISRVIAQFTAAVTNTGLYSPQHPQVAQYIDRAYSVLTELLKIKPEITVILIGDDLVAEGRPLTTAGAYVQNFVRIMKRKAVERMTFLSGLPRNELISLIQDMASTDGTSVRSSAFIKLGRVELRVKEDAGLDVTPQPDLSPHEMDALLSLTAKELDELKELYFQIKKHRKLDVRGVDEIVKGFIKRPSARRLTP